MEYWTRQGTECQQSLSKSIEKCLGSRGEDWFGSAELIFTLFEELFLDAGMFAMGLPGLIEN